MIKIFKTKINKLIALFTATSLLLSFVVGPAAASAINNEQTTKEYNQVFKEFILPYSYGKITNAYFAATDRVIINIQDLHCHPKVQKNISNIIEIFDEKYGVNNIYLEGAYGNVSTKWLTDKIQNNKSLLEKMLDTGRLTGAEYYSALSNKTEIIKGLEEKEPYLDNIVRLGSILNNQEKIDLILNSLDESVNEVKKKYYSKRQYKIENLFKEYKQGKINSQKYYTLLSKHIDKLGIDLTKYENTLIYITLLKSQKKLNYKQITSELQSLIYSLKQKVPYNVYKKLLENTDNFKELEKLYSYIIQLDKNYNFDVSLNFPKLDKYFKYIELSKKINPVELIKEDEFLSQEINTRFSQTKAQKDVVFLVHFGRYLRDYVTTKITLEDYKYYKDNIEQYRQIYNKYVDNRVLSLLDEYIAQIDKFYEINMDRNFYFTKNLFEENEQFVQIEQVKQEDVDINKIISNMDEVKKVDIVVTGGFHSQTVTELLKEHNVSYIVITPNVTDGIKLAEDTYNKILQEQGEIDFQMIAPVIASLSSQLQIALLKKIETQDTQKIEQIISMSGEERAQMIAELSAAKLLESDDVGKVEEKLHEIVETIVGETVTPELISQIKNLQELLKDKEQLQKTVNLLSEKSQIKKSLILLSNMLNDILDKSYEGLDELVSFTTKNKGIKGRRSVWDERDRRETNWRQERKVSEGEKFLKSNGGRQVRQERKIKEKILSLVPWSKDGDSFYEYIKTIKNVECLKDIHGILQKKHEQLQAPDDSNLDGIKKKMEDYANFISLLKTKKVVNIFSRMSSEDRDKIYDLYESVLKKYKTYIGSDFLEGFIKKVSDEGYSNEYANVITDILSTIHLISEFETKDNIATFVHSFYEYIKSIKDIKDIEHLRDIRDILQKKYKQIKQKKQIRDDYGIDKIEDGMEGYANFMSLLKTKEVVNIFSRMSSEDRDKIYNLYLTLKNNDYNTDISSDFLEGFIKKVSDEGYSNEYANVIIDILSKTRLISEFGTGDNIATFLSLSKDNQKMIFDMYTELLDRMNFTDLTFKLFFIFLNKGYSKDMLEYLAAIISELDLKDEEDVEDDKNYVSGFETKEINEQIFNEFISANFYVDNEFVARYTMDLLFSDIDKQNIPNFNIQELKDLFDNLSEYEIDALNVDNKALSIVVFFSTNFIEYCNNNGITDFAQQYYLSTVIADEIYSLSGEHIFDISLATREAIISRILDYYDQVSEIASSKELFSEHMTFISLHNNERNKSGNPRFTPQGIKEVLEMLEIREISPESDFIEVPFIERDKGNYILSKSEIDGIFKKVTDELLKGNKVVLLFDGHGQEDGFYYSENGKISEKRILDFLMSMSDQSVDLGNLTLMFSCCHSDTFINNIMYKFMMKGTATHPQIISESGKETDIAYDRYITTKGGEKIKVSSLFYSLLKFLQFKDENGELEQMKGRLTFRDLADAPKYLSNHTISITNRDIAILRQKLEEDIRTIIKENDPEGIVRNYSDISKSHIYSAELNPYAQLLLPETKKFLDNLGETPIIKKLYKNNSGKEFKKTKLGIAIGVFFVESISFWLPNFVEKHENMTPEQKAGARAVVWRIKALSIGIGFGLVPAIISIIGCINPLLTPLIILPSIIVTAIIANTLHFFYDINLQKQKHEEKEKQKYEIEIDDREKEVTILVNKDGVEYSIVFDVLGKRIYLNSIDSEVFFRGKDFKKVKELSGIEIKFSKRNLTITTPNDVKNMTVVKYRDVMGIVAKLQKQNIPEQENEQALIDETHSKGIERIYLDRPSTNNYRIANAVGENKLLAIYPFSHTYDVDSLTDEELAALFCVVRDNIFQLTDGYFSNLPKIISYEPKTGNSYVINMNFMIEEFIKNAFVHGNLSDPSKPIYIKLDGDKFTVYNAVIDGTDATVSKENRKRRLTFSAIVGLSGVHKGIETVREYEKEGLVKVEQESEHHIGTKKYFVISVEKAKDKKTLSTLMLPSTQDFLNWLGNTKIIRKLYKNNAGENFKYTNLGLILVAVIELPLFALPNVFIEKHNFDPSVKPAMTAVVFGMLGLTIGVGLITGTIWKAALANMILHFIWDRIVTLIGRKDLMLQIPGEKSKIEQITIPKQESKEEQSRALSQEEITNYEQFLQKTILENDTKYQYQPNPEIQKDIEEIFGKLLDAMVAQGKITVQEKQQYRIHYYYSPVANAYVVPNTRDVFIFSQLLYELAEEMKEEDKELTKDHIAAILAHELQHTVQKNKVYKKVNTKKGDGKRKEYDADRESIFILEQAGYNPRAVEETMTALSFMSDSGTLEDFLKGAFDEHPDTKNRLKEISEILEDPSLVFLSMTKEQQKFSSSVQKYGQDFQRYLATHFNSHLGFGFSLDGEHLQQILNQTEFFEQMSIFDMRNDINFYNSSTKDFVFNNILNGNYKFFTKAENDFIKNCSDEEKEVVFCLLFSSSTYINKLIEKLENRQKKDLFIFCIDILKTVKVDEIENKGLLFYIVSKMNPTEQELKKFLDFRTNNKINVSYSTETAYFWLTNYKYLSDNEISNLLGMLMITDPIFDSEGLPPTFDNFSQEQKEESLKLMLKILLEKKSYYPHVVPAFQQHSMHFINFFMRSSVLTKQEKFEFLFKLSQSINNEHKEEFNNFFLNLFDELHSDKTNIEKILYLFEIFDDYDLSDVFSYDDLMDRYDISNHDFSVDELRKMALSTKYLISRFDVFFLGYFLKLHNKDIKIYFVKDEKLSYDEKYSDGICLYHGMDVEKLDKSLFRNVTLNDLMDFQNFMLENNCWCQNISYLMCFIAEKVLNLSDIEKVKLNKILTLLPKGQSSIEKINGDISSIPYEHLKNLVNMQIFYKDINEQTMEISEFDQETSFVAFYVPFLEFKTFKPDYSAVSFEKTVENIKNHFDAYSFFQEPMYEEKNGEEKIKIFISLEDDLGNPDEAEQRIKNTEIEKAWLVELHRIFELSPKEKNVEFNHEGKQFVYTYFELDEQLFNDAFVPTAQQAQQLINAFSIIKKELPQETVDVYAKLVYSLLKRNSSLSVFSSAKDNLELLDLLFEDFSAVKDGYITELLDNYNVTVEEYRKLISKTRLYSFGSNSEKNNENVTNLEIINTILPTLSDSEKISFFFWLLSGNDSYKPQMLKQIRPINFDYEGEINFNSLQKSFRSMTKTERENFIRKILLGKSGIIEKGKTTAEKNSKEFEQGLKNILFDDFFLSSFSSSKIKASSMSIVFKNVFSIVFNNLSDERKVLFVNNLISSLAEIKNSDEKDTDEQKARQLGKLIVALGTSSGVMVVKLLQILSNNRVFEALDEKYGSIINEEVAKVKSENEPLSKSVLFQYLENLGVSSAVEYVGKRLGSASIGITYLLKLKNMSELVVAKIKRPNINKNYSEDFKIADKILEYFKGDSSLIPSIYKKTLPSTDKLKTLFDEELEFEKESENLKTFNEQLKKRNSKIKVPQLVETVDGIKVYTQNLFLQTTAKGKTLDKIKVSKKQKSRIYFEVLKEFFTEVFVDPIENGSALYHADLHTGNIFVDEQGNISFIDLGGVGNISAQQSKSLKNIFMYMYSGNYENFINALKSYNSKLYKDLEQANALKKTEEILNRKTSLESKFVDLFEIFNSLENIDSDFMMFIQAISKISSYLDNLGKKEQLLLLNNLSFKKGIQFKIISDSILTAVASIFKRMRFGKKQKEVESYEVTQEDMFREKLLSNYPDISSEKIDLLLSLDPFIMKYIKNNTVSLTQEQLIKGGILADKFYKQKIITEQNNKTNILFKILSTTDFSEQNIEKLLSLDENTIERIISEITENKKIEVLFIKAEQLNIELIYKNDDLSESKKFDRILMFAKGAKLNRSQNFHSSDLEAELKKANMLFSLSPETILKEKLLEDEIKLFSLYSVVKGLDLSLEEDIDIIEILAPFSVDEINHIETHLTTSNRKSKKDIKRFIYLYNDYRNIFSKKGEAETLSKFVENNENDEQIREFFDLAIKNKSIGTIKNIAYTSRSFDDIILSSEFALGIILFRCKALGIPIDENNQDFADMLKSLKNISYKEGQERISSLDEEIYKKLFSIRSNDKLMELLKYISAHNYDKIGLKDRLNKAFLEENLPERFIKFLDDYNQFEHMENLPSFAFTDTEKREATRELYEEEISKLVSEKYQFEFAASTKYLYVLQNRNNKDELLDVVSREDAELKFKLLALMYLVRIRRGLTQEEMNVMTVSRYKIITEFKNQLENNSFKVSNNFDLRSYMMGIYLLLQDDSLSKPVPEIIYNAFMINTDGVVLANSDGFFARVDLFTIVHELTHVVVSKPGFYSKLVADTVDELVSYVTPNMFLAMAKLSFKAYSKVQTGYTMHQTKGIIDYVKMGKKLHVLYNLFSERTIDHELIQEEHSAPIAFLELLFNAHANVGKMVDWNILLEAIKTMDDENLDQSSVFEDVLYTYTKMLVAKDKLTKKETDKLLKEMEKMQMWTLLSFDIVQNIKAIDPDTYSKILGNNNEFYFGEQILSNPAKTKEQLEKFSNVIKSKEQLSKDDILILLITDIISEVDYEQLINNFDGVIEGIINVVKGAVQIFDMQKENYSLSEYEQIAEYVKDNYNISTSPITAVKEKIFDFISNSLNKAFFAKLLLNKVFGIKDLNNIMKEKKLLIVTSKQQEQNLKQKLQKEKTVSGEFSLENTEIITMEIITEPTKIIRSDMILDIRNGIRARYDAKENKLVIYSKRGVYISEEQIQSLIMQEYFAERSEDIVTGDVIAFAAETDTTLNDISNRLKTAYTASVTMANKEQRFDLSSKPVSNIVTSCKQEFAATGVKTFTVNQEQAEKFNSEIKSLQKQDFKFIILCKYDNVADVTDYDGLVINATEIKDINQATKFMESLKKKVLKQGLAKQISIKFNNDIYSQFESLNRDILNEFGISPIVNAEKIWNVGKCEVENITENNIEQLLRNNLVTGIVIDNARVFVGKKGIIKQLFSKEHKYNKGYNAALSSKFDYTCADVKILANYLDIEIVDNKASEKTDEQKLDKQKLDKQKLEKLKKILSLYGQNSREEFSSELLKNLSADSKAYLKYLADKNRDEELLGFIRGIAMNSAKTQVFKGLEEKGFNLDMKKFAKEANGKYQKAFLTVAVQLMMEGTDITTLLETDYIDSSMTAKQYLDSVYEKVNINIEDILKQNEYKIERTQDTAKTIEDFKNYVVLLDNLRIIKETTVNYEMSVKAIRGMLAAA